MGIWLVSYFNHVETVQSGEYEVPAFEHRSKFKASCNGGEGG